MNRRYNNCDRMQRNSDGCFKSRPDMFEDIVKVSEENGKSTEDTNIQELMMRSAMLVNQTSDAEITIRRSYPYGIVIICIVVAIVLPILAPFVIYILFKMKFHWSRGHYDKSNRLIYCAIKMILGGVALFVVIGLISTLVLSVLAYQKGSEISNFFNMNYERLGYLKTNSKSMPLYSGMPTNQTTEPNVTITTNANFTTVSVGNNDIASTFNGHEENETVSTSVPKTTNSNESNFETFGAKSWIKGESNSTHMTMINKVTGENKTIFIAIKLPDY